MPDASHPQVVTYTADLSICSQICRLAVQEHNLTNAEDVAVDIEYAMDNYEPWFARLQPTMTVPVMCYGDRVIGDSKDILYFLAERHADRGLYPKAARSKSIDWDHGAQGLRVRASRVGANSECFQTCL